MRKTKPEKIYINNLKLYRKLVGYTQEEFGKLVGVSNITVHNWEKKKKGMTQENYNKCLEVLGIKPGQII